MLNSCRPREDTRWAWADPVTIATTMAMTAVSIGLGGGSETRDAWSGDQTDWFLTGRAGKTARPVGANESLHGCVVDL